MMTFRLFSNGDSMELQSKIGRTALTMQEFMPAWKPRPCINVVRAAILHLKNRGLGRATAPNAQNIFEGSVLTSSRARTWQSQPALISPCNKFGLRRSRPYTLGRVDSILGRFAVAGGQLQGCFISVLHVCGGGHNIIICRTPRVH